VRHNENPSLSVCAFGAGAAHAAILALVLPVMITLPAPDDRAQGTVAIQVVVRSEPPPTLQAAMADTAVMPLPAFMGEGDIDQDGVPVVPHEETTGSLPEVPVEPDVLPAYAAVSKAALPDQAPETAGLSTLPKVERMPAPDLDVQAAIPDIASIDSREAPAMLEAPVPVPLRKPLVTGIEDPDSANAEEPVRSGAPRQRAAASQRHRSSRSAAGRPAQARRTFGGILGGRQATTMPEYPFAVHH